LQGEKNQPPVLILRKEGDVVSQQKTPRKEKRKAIKERRNMFLLPDFSDQGASRNQFRKKGALGGKRGDELT